MSMKLSTSIKPSKKVAMDILLSMRSSEYPALPEQIDQVINYFSPSTPIERSSGSTTSGANTANCSAMLSGSFLSRPGFPGIMVLLSYPLSNFPGVQTSNRQVFSTPQQWHALADRQRY